MTTRTSGSHPTRQRLAVSLVDPKLSVPDIWLTDLVRGGTSRFTFGPAFINASAVWSPEGERILFRTNRKGLIELYQKAASAGGNDEPFLLEKPAREGGTGVSTMVPTDWSPDGQYVSISAGEPSDLWLVPVTGDRKPVSLVRSPSDQGHANFSPNGRFIAYSTNESESGRYEVYVETLPPSDRKWPISTNGGYEPRWRADGREIYYLAEDRKLMGVPVSSGAALFGVPTALFQTDVPAGVSLFRTHYVPSRDGTRFLVHTRSGDLVPASITVVLNWTAGLKK